jgi:hypothetical protein
MHALSKALFFSTGAVGLLTLVFFGAVIEFNALSLKHFTQVMIEFRFMDYSLPEILGLGQPDSITDHLFKLKVGLGLIIGFGSLTLIVISFLPSPRMQFKLCSFAISLPLLGVLFGFWIKFIHDDRTVSREEKMGLFSITLFSYPSAVFIFWYGLHVKRRSAYDLNDSKYISFQPRVSPANTIDTAKKLAVDTEKTESDESEITLRADNGSAEQLKEPSESSEELADAMSDVEDEDEITLTAENEGAVESEIETELNSEQPEFTTSEQEEILVEVPDLTPETDGNNVLQNKSDASTESAEVVSGNNETDLEQSSSDDLRMGEKTPQSDP